MSYVEYELEKLGRDARYSRDLHEKASSRKVRGHVLFGLPAILINGFLGSVLFTELTKGGGDGAFLNLTTSQAAVIGATLAFIAALLGAIQTFFNFEKQTTGHRTAAAQYLEISDSCRKWLGKVRDDIISREQAWEQCDILQNSYQRLNKELIDLRLSNKDVVYANRRGKRRTENGLTVFTEGVTPQPVTVVDSPPRAVLADSEEGDPGRVNGLAAADTANLPEEG